MMQQATSQRLLINEVAVYLRKSRGESIEDLDKHKSILLNLCKQNKWKYTIYEEIAGADTLKYRPKMLQLLRDIKLDLYDAVVVVDYDRLSRGDKKDQATIENTLSDNKTYIITPQKVYNLDDESDVMLTDFLGMLARWEYNSIKKRFRRGKKAGALAGNWTNGPPPFPYVYDREKKIPVVNSSELPIYEEMKAKALAGYPMYKIAEELNKKGYRTRRGKIWHENSINRILTNEVHLGYIIDGKTEGSSHKNKNTKPLVKKDRSEWIIVKGNHEPVITQEEYDKIQEILRRNRVFPTRARSSAYPLSGLVKCGKCGASMSFSTNASGVYVKKCQRGDGFGNRCGNGGVKQGVVIDVIKERIKQYENELIKINKELYNKESERLKMELEMNIVKLAKINKAFDRLRDIYEMGDYTRDEFSERREKRQKEIKSIKEQIENIKKAININERISNEDRLKNIRNLKTFWKLMHDEEGLQNVNRALKKLIKQIRYTRENNHIHIEIEFY